MRPPFASYRRATIVSKMESAGIDRSRAGSTSAMPISFDASRAHGQAVVAALLRKRRVQMIRATAVAILSFFGAASLIAESIRFDPPNPHPMASVDAIVSGTWPDGCHPEAGEVRITGSTVTLALDPSRLPRTSCEFGRPTAHETRYHLGILPAGVYTVLVEGGMTSVAELGRETLVVRDRTLLMRPYAISTSGQKLIIGNPFHPDEAVVTIDGVEVRATPTGGASQLLRRRLMRPARSTSPSRAETRALRPKRR
jgi:hypothetical protein